MTEKSDIDNTDPKPVTPTKLAAPDTEAAKISLTKGVAYVSVPDAPSEGEATESNGEPPKGDNSGRGLGAWQTRYPSTRAQRRINVEGAYLTLLLGATTAVTLWLATIDSASASPAMQNLRLYGLACVGGLLGGWMFTLRWLINAVAAWRWDEDRRLWRLLNPFIAGVLALTFFAVIRSGLFQIFSPDSVRTATSQIARSESSGTSRTRYSAPSTG
jgi:hypothetical protein